MAQDRGSADLREAVGRLAEALEGLTARVVALDNRVSMDIANVVRSGNGLQAELQVVQQVVADLRASGGGGKQRFKIPAPRKFSEADGTRTLLPWLTSLRAYVEFCDARPNGAQLASYLEGQALNAFTSHQKNCGPNELVTDLDSFERVLKQLMNLGNLPEVARMKMKQLRQGSMHITEYNSAFGALASECPDRSAFDMIGDYVDGLSDAIRKDVKMQGCVTLLDAMQKAVAASGIDGVSGGAHEYTHILMSML